MNQDSKAAIRSHSQEREWLLNLGNGNIVTGVRQLVKQKKEKPSRASAAPQGKNKNH